MKFALVCEIYWTKVKWCSRKVFFHFIGFGYKNVKINFFEEKSIFSKGSTELKCMWLQTALAVLKNTKHLKFCLWQTFYVVFKISHFL